MKCSILIKQIERAIIARLSLTDWVFRIHVWRMNIQRESNTKNSLIDWLYCLMKRSFSIIITEISHQRCIGMFVSVTHPNRSSEVFSILFRDQTNSSLRVWISLLTPQVASSPAFLSSPWSIGRVFLSLLSLLSSFVFVLWKTKRWKKKYISNTTPSVKFDFNREAIEHDTIKTSIIDDSVHMRAHRVTKSHLSLRFLIFFALTPKPHRIDVLQWIWTIEKEKTNPIVH